MTELPIRTATAADWPAVEELRGLVSHRDWDGSDEISRALYEPDRGLVVEDTGRIVGHACAYTRTLSVPGGTLPAAHVTKVGVAPTHTRRRLLTRMMHRQLAEAPEPLAVLWATEARIYGRFGYGIATRRYSFTIDTREVRLPAPREPGRLRMASVAEARPALQQVYEAVRVHRPGWSDRDDRWWARILADRPEDRNGATALRVTLHEGPGGVDGYALWRVKDEWSGTGPQSQVRVREVVAAGADAYLSLWRFLLGVDLARSVTLWLAGPDEPLLHLVDEPRRLGITVGDGLHLRLVDLPAALTGRRYATAVDVVLEVTDELRPDNAGRWRLTADGDAVSCDRTTDPPDLACDIADLAAAYLGGSTLGALAAAGRVVELRAGALTRASAAFAWHPAPSGLEIY